MQEFQLNLMSNIISLHNDLVAKSYKHGFYEAFKINDPKPRNIHKAPVRDRLLHHATHRVLYPFFDKRFIADSFSCRFNKGTHKAINRFTDFARKVSRNNTGTCWVLKCDIRKFFENINHGILLAIFNKYIHDENLMWLLGQIISSFSSRPSTGLPLGNLTSQLFVNIYMNEFDQFIKHKLKAKYYIRYADDFIFLSNDKNCLKTIVQPIKEFLYRRLKLEMHPNKIFIKTLNSGVDFLGWVNFNDYRILRTATKKRMIKRLKQSWTPDSLNSYLGLLKHGNGYKLHNKIITEAKNQEV